MQRLTISFVSAAFLLLCAPQFSQGAAHAWVEPAEQTWLAGESFSVNIMANLGEPIAGWGLDLAYESSILTLVGTPTIGPLWLGGTSPDGDGLAALAFPVGIAGGNRLLATLNFLAAAEGETDLTLSVTSGDLNEGFAIDPSGMATVTFAPGHVIVTPEPAAGLIMLAGVGLLSRRRAARR